MKKQNKAFTLAETLVVLCVIGVISVLMLSSIGNKINRSKALFKKAYSLAERTVVELVNDETYYPYDFSNFGFKETSDVNIIGADYYTSTTDYNNPKVSPNTEWGKSEKEIGKAEKDKQILIKFCNLFSNNLNIEAKPKFNSSQTYCDFSTTDGIAWRISKNSDYTNGFVIKIDTNPKGPNQPTEYSDISSQHSVKNRDRFYMFVRNDGKMEMPDNDITAKSYLKATDFKDDEQ